MNLDELELKMEVEHLNETTAYIDELIAQKNVNIDGYKKSIVESKKFLWQNLGDYKKVEMYATMDEEDLNVHLLNADIVKVYKLYRSKETPYFSRIDFKTSDEESTYYIGLTGVDRDYEPLVYDWRAPVANLYYNYGIGKAKYEVENDCVEGETTLKRQFDIKMGKLVKAYDSTSDTHDELLETVLSHNTSEQMKNIVQTIQKEQNEIIRYGGSSNLIVEGVAGSGKTSVALHRVAYLLYNQKGLTNKNVLILSPNSVFSNYISNVLPELGEENVLSTTFDDFATNFIKGKKVESITEFIERHYEMPNHKDKSIEQKTPIRYKDKLNNFLEDYFASLVFTKKMGLKKTFITARELNYIKTQVPKKLAIHDRFVYMAEKVCAKFQLDEVKNVPKMTETLMNVLGVEKDILKLYENFSHKVIEDVVPYEDIFAILYLYFEVWGYPSYSHIEVVVVDEAQDYSMWQFEFLRRIFNRAVFTILGDKNQRVNPYIRYNSMEEIADVFKNSKYKKLFNTYRSSKEIIDYSNSILGLTGIKSIRPSNGLEVALKTSDDLVTDIKEEIIRYKSLGFDRLAVVTKKGSYAKKLEEAIKCDDVTFIPVYLAKGLEFDAVIVANEASEAFTKEEDNLLYVAATRALHGLTVFNQ